MYGGVFLCGGLVVSVLDSSGQKFVIEISVPLVPPGQLSYDEYTDRTLSVGR